MVLRELRRAGYDPQWERVDTEAEYVARLEGKPDLVLADYTMPHFSAKRALTLLQESEPDLPFIIISGTMGEDQAVEVMRQGAWDYLLKDRMGRLGPAVALALEKRHMRKEYAVATEALRKSEHKYRHLFENLSEAAFLIDCATHRIVDLNLRAEELVGRPRAEVLDTDEITLFPAEHTAGSGGRMTNAISNSPGGHWMEAEVCHTAGTTVQVQISITTTELNQRAHILALMTDITARKQKEETLRSAKNAAEESSALTGGLLTNMTREIRSPMSGLVGLLDVLMEEIPPKRREMLESGRMTAISLLRMLDESEKAIQAGGCGPQQATAGKAPRPGDFWD